MSYSPGNRIRFTTITKIAKAICLDMYLDYEENRARVSQWVLRGFKELSDQYLYAGLQKVVLSVNKNLNNVVLPCDFDYEVEVSMIDDCGYKIPLKPKGKTADIHNLEEVP